MLRRSVIKSLALAAAPAAIGGAAFAQDKPLRIVIPYPPGGASDVVTRLLTQSIGKTLNRSVVAESRPGAAGLLASRLIQNSPADGSTVMIQNFAFASLPHTRKAANYDPVADFTTIAHIAEGPSYLYVNGSIPARTLAELIAYAKTVPQGLESATSGPGGGSHISTLLLAKRAGIALLPVPYKGGAEMAAALMSGDAKILISNATEPLNAQVRAGKLRILGVASSAPSPLTPGVPTIAQTLPGFVVEAWYGIIGPARMPSADVSALSRAIETALLEPGVKERYMSLFMMPKYLGPREFSAVVAASTKNFKGIMAELGIQPQ